MANVNAIVSIAVDNDAMAENHSPEERRQGLRMIEALIFASSEPVAANELASRLPGFCANCRRISPIVASILFRLPGNGRFVRPETCPSFSAVKRSRRKNYHAPRSRSLPLLPIINR